MCQEQIVLEANINLPSPMITQQYPDISGASNCGFETCLTLLSLPLDHPLKLHVVLEDESIVPICAILLESPTD